MRKLLVFPLLLLAVPATAEVYRYVDENGTVVFTDQRPSEEARPMNLPELTVMDSPEPARAESGGESSDAESEPEPVYPDLIILSPERDETFQGTGNSLTVRLGSRQALRSGDELTVFLNGQEQTRVQSLSVNLEQVPRGTHELRAEIRDQQNRVVGETGTVTFHMKQHSQLHNNQPMINPPSG